MAGLTISRFFASVTKEFESGPSAQPVGLDTLPRETFAIISCCLTLPEKGRLSMASHYTLTQTEDAHRMELKGRGQQIFSRVRSEFKTDVKPFETLIFDTIDQMTLKTSEATKAVCETYFREMASLLASEYLALPAGEKTRENKYSILIDFIGQRPSLPEFANKDSNVRGILRESVSRSNKIPERSLDKALATKITSSIKESRLDGLENLITLINNPSLRNFLLRQLIGALVGQKDWTTAARIIQTYSLFRDTFEEVVVDIFIGSNKTVDEMCAFAKQSRYPNAFLQSACLKLIDLKRFKDAKVLAHEVSSEGLKQRLHSLIIMQNIEALAELGLVDEILNLTFASYDLNGADKVLEGVITFFIDKGCFAKAYKVLNVMQVNPSFIINMVKQIKKESLIDAKSSLGIIEHPATQQLVLSAMSKRLDSDHNGGPS